MCIVEGDVLEHDNEKKGLAIDFFFSLYTKCGTSVILFIIIFFFFFKK
jgi:hypothetical protein